MKTIRVTPTRDRGYESVIVASRILRLSKDPDSRDEGTWVHLDGGEKLFVTESLNTLEARINSKE